VAYLLFVLPIVGLLAIFGIALRVPGGSAANETAFSFSQRKWLNLLPAADPANGQNAAIPIRLKTKHRPAVRIRP